MTIFKLPDLGEGLPDAEIHEWYVKEGDEVGLDQPIVAMETAKAVVDVPSPQSGRIEQLYGRPGEVIKTGMPLVRFSHATTQDQGTVVGHLETSVDIAFDDIPLSEQSTHKRPKATPKIKRLAQQAQLDWTRLVPSGPQGLLTEEDILKAIEEKNKLPDGFEALRGFRRSMMTNMSLSHDQVVPVTIYDEVNISQWYCSEEKKDITLAVIKSICVACTTEPSLNAWFNTEHAARKLFNTIHLGLAIDSAEGLFVPVIHDVQNKSDDMIRQEINTLKTGVNLRNLPPDAFQQATITLSNFGKFAGRFASPIIVPPTVAIIAIGKIFEELKQIEGVIKPQICLPISLSFDHRAITGGEATRFLKAMSDYLLTFSFK